jgi:hypothetical protein
MSRESVLLGALTAEPTSTSDLYERVGYGALARVGLIPYHAFRAELARLEATGVVESATGTDGSTMWRTRPDPPVEEGPILDGD